MKRALRFLLAVLFAGSGVNHFANADFYLRMMPAYLPWHEAAVVVSGVLEVALGALLLVERTRRLAALSLIALLVVVFPANVHMALHPEAFPGFTPWTLWARLPLQGVLIAWAFAMRR